MRAHRVALDNLPNAPEASVVRRLPTTTTEAEDGYALDFNENPEARSPARPSNESRQTAGLGHDRYRTHGFRSRSIVTMFNLLEAGPVASNLDSGSLPGLPSAKMASHLVQTVYLYTQARYCIVDWAKVRDWHLQKDRICFSTQEDDVQDQIGAFFLWAIYAIGAQFVPNAEHTPEEYYARAHSYLEVVLAQQNLHTIQAFLTLIQFYFRASVSEGSKSHWRSR
ncbi:hypothetical protein QQS21_011732 [Conoideocrella luteorostrata]|uniref:Uncharacterized protein n=1 Tax=Conoideocrella luteorostrata TaxID=1105319 RepID=A0AAJ0CCJ9_9HYPO|nr:hypothetical protein QQS21_011732 [Conoideocrella luteorostrata]